MQQAIKRIGLWLLSMTTHVLGLFIGLGLGIGGFSLFLNLTNCSSFVSPGPACRPWALVAFGIGGLLYGLVNGIQQWLILRLNQIHDRGWWILASVIGWANGAIFALGIILPGSLVRNVIIYSILGAIPGLVQWFVLKRYVRQAGWWVLGSAASMLLFGLLSETSGGDPKTWAVGALAMGTALNLILLRPIKITQPENLAAN